MVLFSFPIPGVPEPTHRGVVSSTHRPTQQINHGPHAISLHPQQRQSARTTTLIDPQQSPCFEQAKREDNNSH